jgi:hypothetical protein
MAEDAAAASRQVALLNREGNAAVHPGRVVRAGRGAYRRHTVLHAGQYDGAVHGVVSDG